MMALGKKARELGGVLDTSPRVQKAEAEIDKASKNTKKDKETSNGEG